MRPAVGEQARPQAQFHPAAGVRFGSNSEVPARNSAVRFTLSRTDIISQACQA
jgi:hypothetical protein